MRRVTGIGGVFLRARDPEALGRWYKTHLGIDIESWGGTVFHWNPEGRSDAVGSTTWSIMPHDTPYFGGSHQSHMVNFRVTNLDEVLEALREEGCDVDEKTERSEYGNFGWVTDPEGHRVELWEPPAGQ